MGFGKGTCGTNVLWKSDWVSSRTNGTLGFPVRLGLLLSRWTGFYFKRISAPEWHSGNQMSLQTTKWVSPSYWKMVRVPSLFEIRLRAKKWSSYVFSESGRTLCNRNKLVRPICLDSLPNAPCSNRKKWIMDSVKCGFGRMGIRKLHLSTLSKLWSQDISW